MIFVGPASALVELHLGEYNEIKKKKVQQERPSVNGMKMAYGLSLIHIFNVLPVDGILSSSTWYAAIPAIPMMTRAAMIAINFFIIYL